MKTGDKEYIKRLNMGIVLDLIREDGPISRAEISRRSTLSRSTCSLLTDELIKSELIIERGKDESSGGRKPVLLELNYQCGLAVGVKLMANAIVCALVDLKGNTVERKKIHADSANETPEEYLRKLTELINDLIGNLSEKQNPKRILGIGIGLSGRIDSEKGILLESSILGWENIELALPLGKLFNIPVFIDNDVNAFAIGEKYFGDGKQLKDFICLTVGRGIGLGIIMNNGIYRGYHSGAGEVGHMKVDNSEDAPVCSCGRKGCLEAFASDPAIVKWVEENHPAIESLVLTIEEIRELASKGDLVCLEAFRRAGYYLGIGLANIINFFDPQAVIIGGEGSNASDYFLPEMRKVVKENAVYGLSSNLSIEPVLFEDDLWVRGIATLVVREVFRIPL